MRNPFRRLRSSEPSPLQLRIDQHIVTMRVDAEDLRTRAYRLSESDPLRGDMLSMAKSCENIAMALTLSGSEG